MSRRGAPGRGLLLIGLLLAAALWQGASPAPVEAAQSALSYTSAGTWRPDMAAGLVHVSLRISATSTASDDGSRRYYFAGLELTLPASSTGFMAADDAGEPLSVRVMSSSPNGVVVYTTFRQRLYSGQTGTLSFEFDLVDAGGSTDRDLHIGRDVASFPVVAFGSPDTPGSSVTVVFPAGYSIQEPFGNLTSRAGVNGETIYSSGLVEDPTAVSAWFTAFLFSPSTDYEVRYVTVAPLQVALRYWADDPAWADQVERILLEGYPVLREMIGRGDPRFRSLTLEESTTLGIGGFSGEYDRSEGRVRISYFADPMVILHELSHLWFDDRMASERWINEGFASYYAEQVILKLGLPNHAPRLSGALMAAAVPLNSWVERGDPGSAREAYLYAASLEAAKEIAEIVGQDTLRQVWNWSRSEAGPFDELPADIKAGAAGGQPTAAPGEGGPAASAEPTSSPSSGPTIAPWLVASQWPPTPSEPSVPPLDWQRLLDYLERASGVSLSSVWERWVTTPAESRLLAKRDDAMADYRLTRALAGEWQLPPDVRLAMANWQSEPAGQLLAQARAVLVLRSQIEATAALEQTKPPPTLRSIFQDVGTGAAQAEAWRELGVLSELTSAREAQATSDGAALVLGLLGSDPDAQLAKAREAFAAGDLDEAAHLAAAARSAWTGASGTGQVRLAGGALALGGLLLLLIVVFRWPLARRPEKVERDEPGDR